MADVNIPVLPPVETGNVFRDAVQKALAIVAGKSSGSSASVALSPLGLSDGSLWRNASGVVFVAHPGLVYITGFQLTISMGVVS